MHYLTQHSKPLALGIAWVPCWLVLTPFLPASSSPFLQSFFCPVGVQPVQLHEVITCHVQNVTIQQMQFLLKLQGDWDTETTGKTGVVKGQR